MAGYARPTLFQATAPSVAMQSAYAVALEVAYADLGAPARADVIESVESFDAVLPLLPSPGGLQAGAAPASIGAYATLGAPDTPKSASASTYATLGAPDTPTSAPASTYATLGAPDTPPTSAPASTYATLGAPDTPTSAPASTYATLGAPDTPPTSAPASTYATLHWAQRLDVILSRSWDTASDSASRRGLELGALLAEFHSVAVALTSTIVSEVHLPNEARSLPALDSVGGVAGGTKYAARGIFLKLALDSEGIYGSDAEAATAAGHELTGLQALLSWAVSHSWIVSAHDIAVRFPLACVVHYMGYTIFALSLLPITDDSLVYGSSDGGHTVHADIPAVNAWMADVGAYWGLAPHGVGLSEPAVRTMALCGDIEAHTVADRIYVLDTHRVFPPRALPPPDALHSSVRAPHLTRLFRPEFVQGHSTPLCADGYSLWGAPARDTSILAGHNAAIIKASARLENELIPAFAANWAAPHRWPLLATPLASLAPADVVDTARLFVVTLNAAGINVDYLGALLLHLSDDSPIAALVAHELAARVARELLHSHLRELAAAAAATATLGAHMPPAELDARRRAVITKFVDTLCRHPSAPTEWSSVFYSTVFPAALTLSVFVDGHRSHAAIRAAVLSRCTPDALCAPLLAARLASLLGLALESPLPPANAPEWTNRFLAPGTSVLAAARASFHPRTDDIFLRPFSMAFALQFGVDNAASSSHQHLTPPYTTAVHSHGLVPPGPRDGTFGCDVCDAVTDPHSPLTVHCSQPDCDFDLCATCLLASVGTFTMLHAHGLVVADDAPAAPCSACLRNTAHVPGPDGTIAAYVCIAKCSEPIVLCAACVVAATATPLPSPGAATFHDSYAQAAELYLASLEAWPSAVEAASNWAGIITEQIEAGARDTPVLIARYKTLMDLVIAGIERQPETRERSFDLARAHANVARFASVVLGDDGEARAHIAAALAVAPNYVTANVRDIELDIKARRLACDPELAHTVVTVHMPRLEALYHSSGGDALVSATLAQLAFDHTDNVTTACRYASRALLGSINDRNRRRHAISSSLLRIAHQHYATFPVSFGCHTQHAVDAANVELDARLAETLARDEMLTADDVAEMCRSLFAARRAADLVHLMRTFDASEQLAGLAPVEDRIEMLYMLGWAVDELHDTESACAVYTTLFGLCPKASGASSTLAEMASDAAVRFAFGSPPSVADGAAAFTAILPLVAASGSLTTHINTLHSAALFYSSVAGCCAEASVLMGEGLVRCCAASEELDESALVSGGALLSSFGTLLAKLGLDRSAAREALAPVFSAVAAAAASVSPQAAAEMAAAIGFVQVEVLDESETGVEALSTALASHPTGVIGERIVLALCHVQHSGREETPAEVALRAALIEASEVAFSATEIARLRAGVRGVVLSEVAVWTLMAGRPADALGLFETALSCAPQNLDALRNGGVAAIRVGDYRLARSMFHKAYSLKPTDGQTADTLVKLMLNDHDYAPAATIVADAVLPWARDLGDPQTLIDALLRGCQAAVLGTGDGVLAGEWHAEASRLANAHPQLAEAFAGRLQVIGEALASMADG
ncbi:uncharacterized protein AMSG_08162 [Thecamonas trahens ATCC 50062]|uniref:Clu domain-containing protein n=1 Tax=Thecamonas trahens ATCC 50062 TaxID=461836 RepID=A0A0L0DKN9_THETB|nr:hypothetical protein AMSG_08162 [Thecamonas trahens ATCC 50062]KNC51923.1 hypothetical protein AMSG_08162 [Thecamonas trahens ATCC 50062]|eukprot:XP_013755519.1 hypothetical protein AMSG_08162 [Thecamonas trahens ATCC 50062]